MNEPATASGLRLTARNGQIRTATDQHGIGHWCLVIGAFLLLSQAWAQPLLPFPAFRDTTLANGLRVLLAEHHEQPAVFLRLLVNAGNRDEAAGQEGLSKLVASLLTQGTSTRDADDIAGLVDRWGARLNASAEDEYTTVECDLLAADIKPAFELFADVVRSPAFAARDLARVRQQAVAALKQAAADPDILARIHSDRQMFGSGPRLGRTTTARSLNHIKPADVVRFHRDYYHPGNATFLAIGDFAADTMLQLVIARLGDWPVQSHLSRPDFRPEPLTGIRLRLVNCPGRTQGHICFAEWGIPGRHPDRAAFRLLNYIFGGSFTSRLGRAIRGEQGRTYGVRSRNTPYSGFGVWRLTTFTRTERVADMIPALRVELDKVITEGITEDELARAKAYYRGALPLGLESPRDVARLVLDGLHQGFTLDELRRELAELEAVTVADVNRVAREWLSADRFTLVVVGDAAKLRPALESLGRFEEVKP